jgi:hypothetical protein
LIIACPSYSNNTGKITIVIRETLKIAKEYIGDYIDKKMGLDLEVFESDDGLQA